MIITDKNYETANQNGISRAYVQNRVYQLGWNVERAVSEPVQAYKKLWNQYQVECEKIGITKQGFLRRVNLGLPPEIAATRPVEKQKGKRWIQDEINSIRS